ncbi:MAG: Ribosomal RNA small subunit methyltransferase I [Chlamydiales bacterium]|nr:Ribosomal RNA small subunit methyltransferase I [Chlamydiales bacterium]MCH9635377.1 Ribosomal RNA small subunit methyltransferase I [Chlamydiales bacterium]
MYRWHSQVVRPGPAKPLSPVRIWVPPSLLYLFPTPIGNLSDVTFRFLEYVKQCDYLLCEDTRRSSILLKHYDLTIPLKSFHLHNERKKSDLVLSDLESGMTIGLLSDAGTPGVNDPGNFLVQQCRERELEVVALPGPCAAIVALSGSGLDMRRFQYFGFLPKRKLQKALLEILDFPGTTIAYESPYRIRATLKKLLELEPTRRVCVARELTKKFESYYVGTVSEVLEQLDSTKGEFVLLIDSNQQSKGKQCD